MAMIAFQEFEGLIYVVCVPTSGSLLTYRTGLNIHSVLEKHKSSIELKFYSKCLQLRLVCHWS
jgi:hypothetical protein